MREIPIDLLRTLLRYEPETGKLFWLERDVSLFNETLSRTAQHACNQWNARCAGKEAFTALGGHGAHEGRIFGKAYYAHIVAWALHNGDWPAYDIDHEDGNRANNCIGNLRDVTHQVNMQNKKLYRSNSSGAHGVTFHIQKKRWQALITVNGKRHHLGTFTNKDDAISARITAERERNTFHANHGRAA